MSPQQSRPRRSGCLARWVLHTPDVYAGRMPVFERLLHDVDDKVRMVAPEIFRVIGKRRPEIVMPYVEQLRDMAQTDTNRVVRIHCMGAIKATMSSSSH